MTEPYNQDIGLPDAEPETWPEYVLAYSIFDSSPEGTPKAELRKRISDAVRRHRGEAPA